MHVHIYDQEYKEDQDNLLVEMDLVPIETYGCVDECGNENCLHDGYTQYGFEYEGKWFEIRVPKGE